MAQSCRDRLTIAACVIVAGGCHRPEEPPALGQPAEAGTAMGTPSAAGSPGLTGIDHSPDAVAGALGARCPRDRVGERTRLIRQAIIAEGITDRRVTEALTRVPRHWFVPEQVRDLAYHDRPLPIGQGQTISQPYIVAAMTAAVAPKVTDKCLDIGTGSGYQAAVLAELCQHTYSIEYLPKVARFGGANLRHCGYGESRVSLRVGNGYQGWPSAAPFDVVVVTAAPETVPEALKQQLAVGGRLVVPVGPQGTGQELELWTRIAGGKGPEAFTRRRLLSVQFVPMVGEH